MKKDNSIIFSEQKKRAQVILDDEVRPQVENYEATIKSSSKSIKLSIAQKAHASCPHQI
jgi:hypothetical protein